MATRFAGSTWSTGVTGSPILEGALVSFDCRIASTMAVGTHDVLYCEVVDVREGEDVSGLIYWSREFCKLFQQQGSGS